MKILFISTSFSLHVGKLFKKIPETPNVGAMEAIDRSKKMMYGYKWKFFLLGLRFLGWAILCIFTFGIGFLWLIPYIQVSYAKFYDDIKNNPITKESPTTATPESNIEARPEEIKSAE